MMKKFIKDNRGQVLYAVIVTVMFMGTISMITMGLTLSNYRAALQKQQHVTDYYAADAVAELIRIGGISFEEGEFEIKVDADTFVKTNQEENTISVKRDSDTQAYTIITDTATIVTTIKNNEFTSWEVSYHAEQPAE
ncbi:MAG: hypothetical protein J6S28_11300 [Clostridia bacterium]|nr:hypothetical protein [Clostridia bacterium]MBO7297246.1 hypothetical protein [Clostridia bacterium]